MEYLGLGEVNGINKNQVIRDYKCGFQITHETHQVVFKSHITNNEFSIPYNKAEMINLMLDIMECLSITTNDLKC